MLRAALVRERDERRRAECLATMQTEVVQLALDLLVREPDIEGFFGGLTKNMVEETESHSCSVWLIDEDGSRCALWLAYMNDQLYTKTERRPRRRCTLPARILGRSPVRLQARLDARRSSTAVRRCGCRRRCASPVPTAACTAWSSRRW